MGWRFTDESRTIVIRDLPSGGIDSRSVEDAEVRTWIDAGNVPATADATPVFVPREVTQRQARMALHTLGHLTKVENAINALPDPPRTEARIAWDFSNTIQRNNPFVSQLATLLELTEQDVDDLFIMAAGL